MKYLEEIRNMKRNQFKNILKKKINELAFKYLMLKRGEKGIEIEHFSIRMADYLSPNMAGLTIKEQQEMFAVINRMVKISYNFPQNNKIDICFCGNEETMNHIYSCKILNKEEETIPYNKIFTGNIGEQVSVFKRFQNNMDNREKLLMKKKEGGLHVIPDGDPLYNYLYSNGYK